MSDADDAKNKPDAQDDFANAVYVNKLATPQAEVTARMMEAFPKCDLGSTIPAPTFLIRGGLSKDDVRALQMLFKRQ
jgi:hypothetical protein